MTLTYDWSQWESGRVPRQPEPVSMSRRNPIARDLRTPKYRMRVRPGKKAMSYDHWKTTEPDYGERAPVCGQCGTQFLTDKYKTDEAGDPICDECIETECDCCGELKRGCVDTVIYGNMDVHACPKCRGYAEDADPAADRGDWACHQWRD